MQIGMSMLLWTPFVDERHFPILRRLSELGYDGVEIPVSEGDPAHYAMLKRVLDDLGLRSTAVGFATAATDPISPEPSVRRAARDHLLTLIERAAILQSPLLGGPIHSAYATFKGRGPTDDERARCVEFLRQLAPSAHAAGVRLGVEFLNRFECYFLTTAAATANLVRAVDHPAVCAVFDTHHAHIEEDDTAASIRALADVLGHVQLSESHRGLPGRGQVHWPAIAQALRDIAYDQWLVIESFSRHDPTLGTALHIFRDLGTPDEVARAGLALIRTVINTGASSAVPPDPAGPGRAGPAAPRP